MPKKIHKSNETNKITNQMKKEEEKEQRRQRQPQKRYIYEKPPTKQLYHNQA